jgi:hypothetical protein
MVARMVARIHQMNLPEVIAVVSHFEFRSAYCPPESGGQRDREADHARGGSHAGILKRGFYGTTPALRATPPDSGGEF